MKYMKFCTMLYACVLISFCHAKTETIQTENTSQEKEISAVPAGSTGALSSTLFSPVIANLKSGDLLDSVTLKNILPKNLLGLDLVSVNSKQSGQVGSMISTSEARYKKDDKTLYVTITDVGSKTENMLVAAPWSGMEFQNTTNEGYEKSFFADRVKTDEQFNSITQVSTLSVIYNERMLIKLFAPKFTIAQLYTVIK